MAEKEKEKEKETDVFDGEIPKDIGKKSPPAWVKIGGLVALVGAMGTAAYMLESDSGNDVIEAGQSEVTEALSGNLPEAESAPEPQSSNEIDIGLSDVQPASPNTPEPPTASSVEPINEAQPGDMPDTDMMANTNNAITITPPADEPVMQSSEAVDTELREDVDSINSRLDEIEATQTDRINIVKTGIDLHTQSIDKLSKLVESLESLKAELAELKNAPTQPAPSTKRQPARTTEAQSKPSQNAEPVDDEQPSNIELVGIDSWGGERFAQIEYQEKIHLLAVNESIGEWRIESVDRQHITVTDKEGESFELRI